MNCPNCGSLVEAESRFCIECGSKLVENERDNKGDINKVSQEQGYSNKTVEYKAKDMEKSTDDFKHGSNKYVIKKLAEHRPHIRARMLMYAGIIFFVIVACIGFGIFGDDAPRSPKELKTQLVAVEQREATNISHLAKSVDYININLEDAAAMERLLPQLKGYQKDIEKTNKQLEKLDKHKDLDPTLAKRIELVKRLGEVDAVCATALINGVEAKLKHGDYRTDFLQGTKAAFVRELLLAQLAQYWRENN